MAERAEAQGVLADYERAFELKSRYEAAATNVPEKINWLKGTSRLWYRKSTSASGGHEFLVFDAETLEKRPAFDHARLAEALSRAAGITYTAQKLPFSMISFVNAEKAIEFTAALRKCRVTLADYKCEKIASAAADYGRRLGGEQPEPEPSDPAASLPKRSPDGKWEVFVRNYNVILRAKGTNTVTPLSFDGSEGNAYGATTLVWSPDSTKLVAYRVRPGHKRMLQYVESSPADQVQPKYYSIEYAKPGDALDMPAPVLFDVIGRKQILIANGLFPNPFELSRAAWRKDNRAFTFEYNQRGHQVYRVIEVDAASGAARAVVDEQCPTFFCYSGKKFRADLADGKEVVWMSERDGWNHLYLYDGVTGQVRNQITRGKWPVREVQKVDDAQREVWFSASGVNRDEDPYFVHYYRIHFDGTGLTELTEGDFNHDVQYSSDMRYYVDTWSRVDSPPVAELRRTEDRKMLSPLERADIEELEKLGWRAPESFTAKGRDGETEIWGVIIKPTQFDPSRRYPVIENIYAGPHSSFVPKSFRAYFEMQSLAELGFIVVQIDGMGTSNRSKTFHDVCWKNLADAGFADRILWHKAAAAKFSYYDVSRVGIYGNSAGGQNAMAALLFHPEFYTAAVASCGSHDNRMDKIWWNEQWMGWPLGPEYVACSNVENAYRLRGKLLLTVGEMDPNVDPASTMQVVNALVKARKTFDFLVLPGMGHSPGGPYGELKRDDFFVRNLLGKEPPDWNTVDVKFPEPLPVRPAFGRAGADFSRRY